MNDWLSSDGDYTAFRSQACSLAVGAGLGHEQVVQFFQVGCVGGMLVIAPLQVGEHTFELSLFDGCGRLDIREVMAHLRAVGSIQEEIALNRCVLLDRFGRIESKAEMFR